MCIRDRKKRAELEKQKARFIDGAYQNGIPKDVAASIFLKIEPFAEYGFNKSHAAAYALIAYQTAYLKTYYKEDFIAATMTTELTNTSKLREFVEELKRLNVGIVRPSINKCFAEFKAENNKIYYGLGAIKNVGFEAISNIVKEREKKVIKLQEGQFANNYSVQELKFEVLPKNVSRLNISEPITPYPHMNFTTGESREGALSRYNAIISELTPAEIAALELVVTLDPQGGTESGFYTIPGNPSNPYIKIKRSKYVIGLRINNPDTQARVNLVLERNGIPQVDSDQNIFAYLPNQNVEMVDPQGNIIDPRNMSRDQANNTIFVSNTLSQQMSKPDILKLAQNNFALNALLVSTLDSLGITSETTAVLSANDLPFSMSIIIEGGVMDYDNSSTRSLRDLNYQSADNQGNFLVYDLKMGKDGKRTEQSITNLEGSEARALRDQVEAGLKAQGLWNQMIEGTDRYVAAVLLPNGTYGLVNLKAEQFSAEDLTGLATDLVERAQLTQKENLDDKGKEKDLAYNSEYNAQLGESLFISTIPGYTVQLQVNPFGKIQMQLFDKTSQQQVGKTVELSKDKINDTSLSVSDKMQTLIDSFNEEADIKASGVSISGKNFRNSFPDGTTVEEIISKTRTCLLYTSPSPRDS